MKSNRLDTIILGNKLNRPAVDLRWVHRPRLIERLEKNLAKRVTLIIAAAGYGKTTLAAQWLAHSQRNVAWLSLNPFDRDQERFLNYVIAAIRAAVQEFGVSIEPLLESPIMPPPEYLAEALVVDIAALKKPLILVLDDFNNIVSEPVHAIVTWAIENLPGRGWSIGTTPIMNYDWKNEEWTIPLNLTTSKTLKIGKTPLKLELEANYYVAQPDAFGPQWMLGLNVTPVVPNFIDRWIHGQ